LPPIVLTVLKVAFLALLYFFVYRTLRTVVVELRQPGVRAVSAPQPAAGGRPRGDRPPKSVVVLNESGRKMDSVPLDGNIQIGRAEACQIRLDDTYVSSFHARIFRRDAEWFVEDLGSTNGTYLNQQRVTSPAELHPGDRLKVGKSTLELRR
jgi:hypothetical protein